MLTCRTAIYTLTGAESFTLSDGIVVRKGDSILRPAFSDGLPAGVFDREESDSFGSWPVCLQGGLGDKIYALPSLYGFDGVVGIERGDEYLYRMVSSRTRPREHKDINVFSGLNGHDGELVDQIAELFGVSENLGLRMPVLKAEKEDWQPEGQGYVLVCLVATTSNRSWEDGVELANRIHDREVRFVWDKDETLLSKVANADCVISVNTCGIPLAGGLQIPLVSIDAPNRAGYFLDVEEVPKDLDAVVAGYQRLMSKERLRCWCGNTEAVPRVVDGSVVLQCCNCLTERQDVKLSKQALDRFYREFYHGGWREVVEHESPYEERLDEDKALSELRIREQWGNLPGSRWLDVGCANGALIEQLNLHGWDALGLETGKHVGDRVGAYHSWDEVPNHFDVISYVDVLEHTFVWEELAEVEKHLAPGGHLVVEIPVAQEEERHYRRLQHLFYFTESTLVRALEAYGFRAVKTLAPISGKRTVIAQRRG